MMTFGHGAVTSFSLKQKWNAKSLTEAELIDVNDALPQIVWTRYFFKEQGYTITTNTLFQDNKSAIIMEERGKTENSKWTKHIKIWYFFITDRVKQKEVNIAYFSTEQMWSDILTKPLQCTKFHEPQSYLMNCPIDYHDDYTLEQNSEIMHALMEDHKLVLQLQGWIGTNVQHMGSMSVNRHQVNLWLKNAWVKEHWLTMLLVDNQPPPKSRSLF